MKKNFLFGLIGAGALILSGSVGFAAWTINAQQETGTGSINVSADGTITDNRITIDTTNSKFQDGYNSVSFAAALNNNNFKDPWLSASPLEAADKLTLKYDVTVTGAAGLNVSATASIEDNGTAVNGTDTPFRTLIKAGIIGELPTISEVTLTDEARNGTYTGTIEATFTWGSKFGNQNPYVYYNSKDYRKDLADKASENIAKLATITNYSGLTLSYTVSVNK